MDFIGTDTKRQNSCCKPYIQEDTGQRISEDHFCEEGYKKRRETIFSGACAPGRTVRTDAVPSSDIRGTYTLILFGANYGDDLETAAFLDKEGDGFDFEPFAPDFVFRTKKGLTADRAIEEAGAFIHFHPDVHGQRLQSIADDKGEIVGYELRPLYFPFSFGTDDVLEINFQLKEKRVLIYVKLKQSVENRKTGNDRNDK